MKIYFYAVIFTLHIMKLMVMDLTKVPTCQYQLNLLAKKILNYKIMDQNYTKSETYIIKI